jgi:hypothetical protein
MLKRHLYYLIIGFITSLAQCPVSCAKPPESAKSLSKGYEQSKKKLQQLLNAPDTHRSKEIRYATNFKVTALNEDKDFHYKYKYGYEEISFYTARGKTITYTSSEGTRKSLNVIYRYDFESKIGHSIQTIMELPEEILASTQEILLSPYRTEGKVGFVNPDAVLTCPDKTGPG